MPHRNIAQPERNDMDTRQLILELAETNREATDAEIRQLRDYVARAGFDPDARERVRGRGAGVVWRGRSLRGQDMLPPAEAHYVRHVLSEAEWPLGTTLDEYLESIRHVILDERSGVFLSNYQRRLQVGFIGRSYNWKGPRGSDWILVEFRQELDHITTAFQIESLESIADNTQRSGIQWFRNPP
jgi:hypothetical protein